MGEKIKLNRKKIVVGSGLTIIVGFFAFMGISGGDIINFIHDVKHTVESHKKIEAALARDTVRLKKVLMILHAEIDSVRTHYRGGNAKKLKTPIKNITSLLAEELDDYKYGSIYLKRNPANGQLYHLKDNFLYLAYYNTAEGRFYWIDYDGEKMYLN